MGGQFSMWSREELDRLRVMTEVNDLSKFYKIVYKGEIPAIAMISGQTKKHLSLQPIAFEKDEIGMRYDAFRIAIELARNLEAKFSFNEIERIERLESGYERRLGKKLRHIYAGELSERLAPSLGYVPEGNWDSLMQLYVSDFEKAWENPVVTALDRAFKTQLYDIILHIDTIKNGTAGIGPAGFSRIEDVFGPYERLKAYQRLL